MPLPPSPSAAARSPPKGAGWSLLAMALLLAGLFAPAVAAQSDGDPPFFARPYKITRLAPDPWMEGMWIGSEGGLFLKDFPSGEVRHFSLTQGLPSPVVRDIAVSPDKVWIATDAGAAVLDKSTQEIANVLLQDGAHFGFKSTAVFFEAPSTVWVGTERAGLFRVDHATGMATAVPNPIDGKPFPKGIFGIGALGHDLYVSVSQYGIVRWDRETDETDKHDFGHNNSPALYLGLLATPGMDVWIGTTNDGVMRLRPDGRLTEYMTPQTTNALTIFAARDGGDVLWMPSPSGVTRYTPATDTWRSWSQIPAGTTGSANDVAFINGETYAATATGSIVRLDPASQTWQPTSWWDESQHPTHNAVSSCQMDEGRILFGTLGGGGNFYDPATGTWAHAGHEPTDQGKVRDIGVWEATADSGRRYYAHHHGVSEMDKATGEYIHYYTDGREGMGRGFNVVKDVELDGEDVWFATYTSQPKFTAEENPPWNPGGVARMDRETHVIDFYGKASGLRDENVTRVVSEGDHVWVGMEKGGLASLDKATGQIRQVHPTADTKLTVNDILLRDDSIWLASVLNGLYKIDRATMQATKVPILAGVSPVKLLEHEGTLWVGTLYQGLFAVDLATLETEEYRSGQRVDYVGNCLMVHEGILYMGTYWGVERFDLAARQFLPQLGHPGEASRVLQAASIAIDRPLGGDLVAAAAPLEVSGRAVAPAGARVMVRLNEGAWQTATGVSSWSAALTLPPESSGYLTVTARLEQDDRVLAQAARTVLVSNPDGSAPDVAALQASQEGLRHLPVLDAGTSEPLRFEVQGNPSLDGLRGQLEIRRPGEQRFEVIPMALDGSGVLSAELPPVTTPGQAEYRILATWDGGSQRFPAPFTGYGPTYLLAVRSLTGHAVALLAGETDFVLAESGPATIEFAAQNAGTRPARFLLAYTGIPAAWIQNGSAVAVDIPAASSRTITLNLLIPEGQKPGSYALDVLLSPLPNEGSPAGGRLKLVVGSEEAGDGSRGAPALGWALPLALACLAAAVRRRR